MRILEITAFSSGICGLWARVSKESELLAKKGHDVSIFSSNIKRGSGKIEFAEEYEKKGNVKIFRFPTKGSFGKNTFFWSCKKQTLKLKPEIIIVHSYRQYYSTAALNLAKKLNIPCVLVTHAPFLEKKLRSRKLNLVVFLYDNLIGKRILNKYSKIFAITKWEIPYLLKLGLKKEKIVYSPNGVPEEFFKTKIPKYENKKQILFLGRVAPIKDLETLFKSIKICIKKDSEIKLKIVGPIEKEYSRGLYSLISRLKIGKNIEFCPAVYDLQDKIKLIDESNIFILSSKREGMPQTLIEVMSRKKIVISSKTDGGKELVINNTNGFLFEIGNEKELAEKILFALRNNKENDLIRKNARESVKKFSWKKLVDEIEKEIILLEKATFQKL